MNPPLRLRSPSRQWVPRIFVRCNWTESEGFNDCCLDRAGKERTGDYVYCIYIMHINAQILLSFFSNFWAFGDDFVQVMDISCYL